MFFSLCPAILLSVTVRRGATITKPVISRCHRGVGPTIPRGSRLLEGEAFAADEKIHPSDRLHLNIAASSTSRCRLTPSARKGLSPVLKIKSVSAYAHEKHWLLRAGKKREEEQEGSHKGNKKILFGASRCRRRFDKEPKSRLERRDSSRQALQLTWN